MQVTVKDSAIKVYCTKKKDSAIYVHYIIQFKCITKRCYMYDDHNRCHLLLYTIVSQVLRKNTMFPTFYEIFIVVYLGEISFYSIVDKLLTVHISHLPCTFLGRLLK